MALAHRGHVVAALGTAQTLAWASTYYLPAMLSASMARDLGTSTSTVFAAFSVALVVSALVGPWAVEPSTITARGAFATLVRLYGHDAHNTITGIRLIAGFASTVGWPLSAWMESRACGADPKASCEISM